MQPAVGYPPGGNAYPTPQGGNYQAVQLGDNSFNQSALYPPGVMPQVQYPPGMVLNHLEVMSLPGMEPYNQLMKIQSMNGLQRLEETKGVFIQQQFLFADANFSGCSCESSNVFSIFQADSNGKKIGIAPILQCKDKSDFCPRCWCGPDCLPMKMKVSKGVGILTNEKIDQALFLVLDRPCQCACLCVNRPVMSIVLQEDGQSKVLGKVKSPCSMCSIGVEIEDAVGNVKYSIEGSLCQMGYICSPWCCEPCFKFDLEIKDASGQVVSQALKKTPGAFKNNLATSLSFRFPERATAEEKALLVGGMLMIDFLHFENQMKARRRRI